MDDRLPSPSLTPLATVLAELRRLHGPAATRTVAVKDALGLVLAEDLVAPRAMPEVSFALRSGYAVSSQDLVGVSAYAPLSCEARPPWLEAGERLPPGCDAVIPFDAVEANGSLVEITASAAPGENVRRTGDDAQAGQVLRRCGDALRPIDLAVAEAVGIREVAVRPVALLVVSRSGDETIAALVADASGARVTTKSFAPDLGAVLDLAAESGSDMAVIIGADAARAAHPKLQILAARLSLAGAEYAQVAILERMPVILLPPQLDAVAATIHCLIRPFVDHLSGRAGRTVWRRGPLTRKLSSALGLTELALLRETKGGLEPLGSGSLTLASLAQAEGFLMIPPESEGFRAGDVIEAYSL